MGSKVVAAGLAVLVLAAVAACGSTTRPHAGASAKQLAAETGESPAAVQHGLDMLAPSCVQDEDRLAGVAYAGANDLEQHGMTMSSVEVMRHIRDSVPAASAPMDCEQVLAAWLVLVEK